MIRAGHVTSGPERHFTAGARRSGPVRFRKHHRPCGQPAVEGGVEFLRPLPAQAGHFKRINAMPSDLPLMSTGRAMYPVPPQRGQSFGSTDPPLLVVSFSPIRVRGVTKLILLRNTNTSGSAPANHARGNGRLTIKNQECAQHIFGKDRCDGRRHAK